MRDPFEIVEGLQNRIPVPVFEMITELGLGLRFQSLDDDISGWIERTGDDTYDIIINQDHPATRKRFTAAHELGHYLYHRDLLGAGTGDTRAYRSEKSPIPNAAIKAKHERQANTFAANLLMPETAITTLKAGGVSNAAVLAEKLGVSDAAMRVRLGL